jgi:NADH:ubiquinone oxidoreductase subunit 2 (subunit N)
VDQFWRAPKENSPRRLLAFIALSQSAAILAGLESGTAEGITGALVHWYVVTVSTVGLFGILRLLEVRFGENLTVSTHLGLAGHAPFHYSKFKHLLVRVCTRLGAAGAAVTLADYPLPRA